jgi:hypothetical protein
LNLYKVHRKDPIKVISYSRAIHKYSGKKSRLKNKFGLSFRYSVEEGKNGKGVINFLDELGYIKTFGFQYDKNNPGNSYQSRMRATQKLIDLIEIQYGISEEKITRDYSKDEIIIVKGLKPKPTTVYVVKNGKRNKETIQRPRKICKTPYTPKVREMRENLELINNVMEEADITLDITDDELMQLNERLNKDSDRYKEAVDFSKTQLHRVFLDRRLDRGGRFYGAWYQYIYKEYRDLILINGIPTVEFDYSAIHPNLIYAIKKISPPNDDLYKLNGYSDDTRKFLKSFFLRIINSNSREVAKKAIREEAFRKGKINVPKDLGNLGDKYLDPLIDKFAEKHKPIADYFFNDCGNYLQWIDSLMAEAILVHFAKKGQPCLPMHDSFIVDCRFGIELYRAMDGMIIEGWKLEIPITDNVKELIIRSLYKVNELSKDWDNDQVVSFMKMAKEWGRSVENAIAESEVED